MGAESQFCKMRKLCRYVSQQYEYTHYWTKHLKIVKMVHFMLYVPYHNLKIFKERD